MSKKKQHTNKSRIVSLFKNSVFFIIIFTAILAWKQRNMTSGEAPVFQATSITGEVINLSSYQGKPLLLHFWASWCPICKFEEGSISDLNKDKDLQLLTIAFQSGAEKEVQSFMMQRNIETWPVIVDSDGSLAAKYGVTGVPATYFIDKDGQIRFKTMGLTSKWGMKIRLWLAGL